MTCENRGALNLFAVSHVIDVRLLKVLVFGKNAAAAIPPFAMANRKSYHITKWVAKAQWDVDGQAKGLPLSNEHRRPRWRIKLNAEPGIALMVRGFSGWLRPLADPCHL